MQGLVGALMRRPSADRYVVFADPAFGKHWSSARTDLNIVPIGLSAPPRLMRRAVWDQLALRRRIDERPALLIGAGNFALLAAPVPQVLLVRQSLYFSDDFMKRILPRRSFRSRALERTRATYLRISIAAADHVVVPSETMKAAVSQASASGKPITVVPYATDLPDPSSHATRQPSQPFTFVYPSHYADYKNFRGLLEAARLLRRRGYRFRLRLNAQPEGFPPFASAWHREDCRLFADPDLADVIARVGPQSREEMRRSLDTGDALIIPSFCESFGHPFLEAMARGLPIVASDLAITREVAGDAAIRFDPWDPADVADAMARIMDDPELRRRLSAAGKLRITRRTWNTYIDELERACERHWR
jgi:glycosyltransferase involved in cell wall biosynthesis